MERFRFERLSDSIGASRMMRPTGVVVSGRAWGWRGNGEVAESGQDVTAFTDQKFGGG